MKENKSNKSAELWSDFQLNVVIMYTFFMTLNAREIIEWNGYVREKTNELTNETEPDTLISELHEIFDLDVYSQ